MSTPETLVDPDGFAPPWRGQLETWLDEQRAALHDCVDGMTEEEARRRTVPSETTLLGLVKHGTFVERVWFEEAVSGRTRADLGIVATPEQSFVLTDDDTIDSVQHAYRVACATSRRASARLALDEEVHGNRRGALPWWWVLLHTLRETAQHCGHADIIREQLLAGRAARP